MKLDEICFLVKVLDFTKDKPELERMYNNAYTVLVLNYGVGLENDELVINGITYPKNKFIQGILDKNRDGVAKVKKSEAKPKKEPERSPLEGLMDDVKETKAVSEPTPKPVSEPVRTDEQMILVHHHKITLINEKNPSDILEYDFTVLPMQVRDDRVRAADIVVICDYNGEVTSFVSKKKQPSIDVEVGNISFTIRGCWEDRKFDSFFYLQGEEMRKTYQLKDQKELIAPRELDKDVFNQFIRTLGDFTIYILPHGRLNEPSGFAKASVVIDDGQTRKVYSPTKDALIAHLNETDFRIYGKWSQEKTWESVIEQV